MKKTDLVLLPLCILAVLSGLPILIADELIGTASAQFRRRESDGGTYHRDAATRSRDSGDGYGGGCASTSSSNTDDSSVTRRIATSPANTVETTEGKLRPAPGYEWANEDDPKDLRVRPKNPQAESARYWLKTAIEMRNESKNGVLRGLDSTYVPSPPRFNVNQLLETHGTNVPTLRERAMHEISSEALWWSLQYASNFPYNRASVAAFIRVERVIYERARTVGEYWPEIVRALGSSSLNTGIIDSFEVRNSESQCNFATEIGIAMSPWPAPLEALRRHVRAAISKTYCR